MGIEVHFQYIKKNQLALWFFVERMFHFSPSSIECIKHRDIVQCYSNFHLVLIPEASWTGEPISVPTGSWQWSDHLGSLSSGLTIVSHPTMLIFFKEVWKDAEWPSFIKHSSCCIPGAGNLTLAHKIHSLYPLTLMKSEGSLYKIVLNIPLFPTTLLWKKKRSTASS